MKKVSFLLSIVLVLLVTGCSQQYGDPRLEIISSPDSIISGEEVNFEWKIDPVAETEHTNIHTSFTADFAERIDTPKQPGEKAVYTDSLTLESDTEQTVYVQAHASIDGEDYKSEVMEITIQPAGN